MLQNSIIYEYNKSSVKDILCHLSSIDNDYAVRLSGRTDITEYSQKLFEKSRRIEAWENGILVGLIAYYINQISNSIFVSNVSVKKEYRSCGIASALLGRLKDNVLKDKITKVVLEADDSIIDFYVKNGFTIGKQISDQSHEMEYYKVDKDIMVSICCLVYNHEPYLRECFEGFVMQQTTFPIEILVHDDASTDHSANIIREYTEKYPDLFKPIYQTENQYSKGISISFKYQFPRAKGKYIAMCEGDDYWTDPLKLQKQVEFLEENPSFSLCFHKVKVWKQKDSVLVDDFITKDMPSETDIYELARGNYIHTPSVVFRNDNRVFEALSRMGRLGVGDYPMWMMCAQYGKIKKIDECMAVYRYGSGIWSEESPLKKCLIWIKMLNQLELLIENEEVRRLLCIQNIDYTQYIIRMYTTSNENYQSLMNSHAYRLGCFLLKPANWIRKMIKRK